MTHSTPDAPPNAPVRTGRLAGAGLRDPTPSSTQHTPTASKPKGPTRRMRRFTPVPESVLQDTELNADIAALPSNYSFEVHKTVHRIREVRAKRVALQMPEGLLLYATTLTDILRRHTPCEDTVVLGDVTFGACCVDDLSAAALGCDFLVHYGHSCLVPVTQCQLPMLYIFVHIAFDTTHLRRAMCENFSKGTRIAMVGTIQFVDTLHVTRDQLREHFENLFVPQARPLSPAELLGCTAPTLTPEQAEVLVYVGDGRFHLESIMIANPTVKAYRYDPYGKRLTEERYSHDDMRSLRHSAVAKAATAQNFAIIFGTLGRQGSPKILQRLMKAAEEKGKRATIVLLSEISPAKIQTLEEAGIDAWVQIACPRLSIDWGHGYGKRPLLNPYEAFVALGKTPWREQYPMDYYAKDGGEWTNYYKAPVEKKARAPRSSAATPS